MAITIPQRKTRNLTGQVNTVGVERTGEDYGAGLASQAANILQQEAAKQHASMNIAAVQEAETGLSEWENESLYGDNGFYKLKGKNAAEQSDVYLSNFDKFVAEREGQLTNEQQKQVFRKNADNRRRDLQRSVMRHEVSEVEAYKQKQHVASIAVSQLAATNNYADEERVIQEVDRQRDSIYAQGNLQGKSAEDIKLEIGVAESTTFDSVISKMLADENYDGAESYFNKYEEKLLPEVRNRLKASVNEGQTRSKSQVSTDAIMNEALPEDQALKKAREIEDPEVRDQTVQRLKTRYAEIDAAKAQAQKENMQTSADIIESGAGVDGIPPNIWLNLTAQQRSSLETRSRQVKSGVEPVTDWKVFTNLYSMEPSKLAKVNMLDYRSQLSNTHYQSMLSQQESVITAMKNGQRNPDLANTLTFKDRTKNVAVSAGILPAGKSPSKYSEDEAMRYGKFQTHAASRIEEFERIKGKKSTGSEQQQILDEMVLETVKIQNESWFGSDQAKFPYEVLADEKGQSYVLYESVPVSSVNSIKNLLTSNGVPITIDRVQRVYAARLLNDVELVQRILNGED